MPSCRLVDLVARGGPRDQQPSSGLAGLGDPDLPPVEDVARRRRAATVEIRVVSVPASGSVTPKHTCRQPSAARGRTSRRSASLPCLTMTLRPKIVRCIALQPFIAAPEAATSSSSSDASKIPSPLPPYSSGIAIAEPAARGERVVELPRELVPLVAFAPVVVAEGDRRAAAPRTRGRARPRWARGRWPSAWSSSKAILYYDGLSDKAAQ